MKKITVSLLIILISLFHTAIAQENKTANEILLVGTSHDLSEEHVHNYDNLYKVLLAYQPDIIITEYRRAEDSLSLAAVYGEDYFITTDSLKTAWGLQHTDIDAQIAAELSKSPESNELIIESAKKLSKLYRAKMDVANQSYQNYRLYRAVQSQKSPDEKLLEDPVYQRAKVYVENNRYDEYVRLAFPLAQALGIQSMLSMDDQTDRKEYSQARKQAFKELGDSPEMKHFKPFLNSIKTENAKALENGTAWRFVNSYKTQYKLHKLEADYFPRSLNETYNRMSDLWKLRNQRMAQNITDQLKQTEGKKIVVLAGCSHVPLMRDYLEQNSKDEIKTLPDILEKSLNLELAY